MHPPRRLLLLLFLGLLPAVAWALLAPPRFPGPHARPRRRAGTGDGVGGYEFETRYFRQRLDLFSFPGVGDGSSSSGTSSAAPAAGRAPAGPSSSTAATRATSPGSPPTPASSGKPPRASPPSSSSPRKIISQTYATLYMFRFSCRFTSCSALQHRYYGESMPFGTKDKAYNNSRSLAYLTAEQALADYAVLLTDLKRNLSAQGSPVVLFGGSYGGMLAAWMRLKYPHISVGALASSAPILQFEDIVPHTIFYDLVSNDFKRESLSCFQTIKDSWNELDEQGNVQDGLLKLSKTFHLCQTVKTTGALSDWLNSAYSYLAMVDYPMSSDFLMPLPASPIKEVCRNIDKQPEGTSTLERIYAGVNIYYNYTGTVECFDLDDDPHGMGGWDWQACTEMVMPMTSSEDLSMFPRYEFDYALYDDDCVKNFGVRPRPRWISTEFGGHNISSVLEKFGSNIIFFNGLLDPWSGGG